MSTDAELSAFCIDFFPQVHRMWGDGMDRMRKVNLLIDQAEVTEIASCLQTWRRAHPAPLRVRRAPWTWVAWLLLAAVLGAALFAGGASFFGLFPKPAPAVAARPKPDAGQMAAQTAALSDCDSVTAPVNQAILRLHQDQAGLAKLDFDAVLRCDPEHKAALQGRGYAFLRLENAKAAAADLEALARLDPFNGKAWLLLGKARLGLGQRSTAQQAFCLAFQLGEAAAEPHCHPHP